MFHHFPDEFETNDYLVRSTELVYDENPVASYLTSVIQSGYRCRSGNTFFKKSLPSLQFEYSLPKRDASVDIREIDRESLVNLPAGIDGVAYKWIDLDGEGAAGILAESAGGGHYKRNLSPLTFHHDNGRPAVSARFDALAEVASLPSVAETTALHHQVLDLQGDGQLDWVVLERSQTCFFERTSEQSWEPFTPLAATPNIDWSDPNLRFIDLTGDGHADLLITEDDVFEWYPSLAEDGFGSAIRIAKPRDEDKGPAVLSADSLQSVFLADMSGDGLTDIVRIRNGEVCYWPNLGYGRFGRKVTMDRSPKFDAFGLFDATRIRLADIDGSGVTDIVYLGRDGAQLHLNQSGHGWSDPVVLPAPFPSDRPEQVQVLDLLGTGTACLVWLAHLSAASRSRMRSVDLMGGQKPHLLTRVANNLGAETEIQYAPSTKFYQADRQAGTPWTTRLAFPVHVVERVDTIDRISRNRS